MVLQTNQGVKDRLGRTSKRVGFGLSVAHPRSLYHPSCEYSASTCCPWKSPPKHHPISALVLTSPLDASPGSNRSQLSDSLESSLCDEVLQGVHDWSVNWSFSPDHRLPMKCNALAQSLSPKCWQDRESFWLIALLVVVQQKSSKKSRDLDSRPGLHSNDFPHFRSKSHLPCPHVSI